MPVKPAEESRRSNRRTLLLSLGFVFKCGVLASFNFSATCADLDMAPCTSATVVITWTTNSFLPGLPSYVAKSASDLQPFAALHRQCDKTYACK